MNEFVKQDIVDGWNRISDAYQNRYDIRADDIHLGPMCPSNSELQLIPDVAGLDVLEVGCGGGQNIVYCARSGAQRCVGIDPSQSQLAHATRLSKSYDVYVDYKCCGADALDIVEGAFDLVIAVYSLMYVEDLNAVFKQIHDRLRQGGMLLVSVDHPFRLSGEWSANNFIVRNYFDCGWQTWNFDFPEAAVEQSMHRYHRTVSDWINAMLSNGFLLQGMYEPLPAASPMDLFGSRSKYAAQSTQNVFHPDNLRRVPGTLILKGIRG